MDSLGFGFRRPRPMSALPAPRNVWEALAHSTRIPPLWASIMCLFAVLSAITVDHRNSTEVAFRVSWITVGALALIWLPALLKVIALTGGNFKSKAGEASTGGLFQWFQNLPADTRQSVAEAVVETVERVETQGPESRRDEARALREEVEEAIASVAQPRTTTQRELREAMHTYEAIRSERPPRPNRTSELTRLVHRMRTLVLTDPKAASPRSWFNSGSEGSRIAALAAVQALRDPRQLDIVIEAIARPKTAFEQFNALRAAREILPLISHRDMDQLRGAIRDQLTEVEGDGKWITPGDSSRYSLAQLLLDSIDAELND